MAPEEAAANNRPSAAALRKLYDRLWMAAPSGPSLILWLALAAVYVLLRINIVSIPLDRDEGLFGYIGQTILDGGLPYRDVVDHKPPVAHYLYALAASFLPPTPAGIHIFIHIYTFGTLLACYGLSKALTGSKAAGLWTALAFAVVSSIPSVQGFAASTEIVLILPATLGLWCAVLAARKHQVRWLVLSGAMGALAFLTKQSGMLLALFSAAYLVAAACRGSAPLHRKLRAILMRSLWWVLGFLVPIALITVYFGLRGGFADLIYWVVTYNLDYAEAVHAQSAAFLARAKDIIQPATYEALPVEMAAAGTILLLLLRRDSLGLFLAGFLGFSLLATVPASYKHYLVQLVPAVALAAGIGISRLCAWLPRGALHWCLGACISALVVGFPFATCPKYYITAAPDELGRQIFGGNPFPEARRIADFVAARTNEKEQVFVLGSEAEILFYANRDGPTPFVLKYPLVSPWSRRRNEYQQHVIAALAASPPRYIIMLDCKASLSWDGTTSFPLYDYVTSLTKSRYALEAIQPILQHDADLIHGDAVAPALAAVEITKGAIFIYRRLL
jgi:4-amino-4-deoxy-L-arabinose transferase-like glycosyltransferase